MISNVRRWLSLLVILLATASCDNVSWGGVDVRLQAPPQRDPGPEAVADSDESPPPPLPSGPVLFRVDREGGSARLSPVGAIVGDSLIPLASEADLPGFREHFLAERMLDREFVLFADGVRVGRFIPGDSTWIEGEACTRPPTVGGVVEVVPEAAGATRFLALESANAARFQREAFAPPTVTENVRQTSANVAGTVIMDAGARWPPSMSGARGDVQLFSLGGDGPPILAATYLSGDQLAIVEAPDQSYSLFYLAEDQGQGYRFGYYSFRVTGTDGKGAARYYGHLDWDGDGSPNVLLEVLGAESRWHAALTRTPAGFVRSYEDPCGSPENQRPAQG